MTHEEMMIAYLERVQEAISDFQEKLDELVDESLDMYRDEEICQEMAWYLQEQDYAISNAYEHVEKAESNIKKLLNDIKERV